ncbi:MAG: PAS domain S-box protein [Promethearchaeota archaeon]
MVSSQRSASAGLKAELNMFKLLADNSPQGIIIFQNKKVIYANATLEKLSGYSLRTINNWQMKDFVKLVVTEDQDAALHRYKDLSKGKVPSERLELRFRPKKGPIRWVDIVNTISQIEGKSILKVVVMDITERKQAEAALQLSEARHRNLFDSVPVGLYRTTRDGRILDVNIATLQLLGAKKKESLLAINADEFYVDSKARKEWQTLMEREGIVRGFEVQFRRQDGQIIWVRDSARAVHDAEGRVMFYEGSLEDITEQKMAEKALQESEAKFRAMVENSLQGLVILQDLRIVYANQAFVEFSGYSIEELLALSPQEINDSIHPEDRALVFGRLKDRLAGKPVPQHYEFRFIRTDGTIRWSELYSSLTKYKGQPAVLVAVIDNTDRKHTETAYRSLVEFSLQGLVIIQDNRIVFANQTFADILGYTIEEMLAWSPKEMQAYVHPEDQPIVWGRYRARLKGKDVPQNYEFRAVRKDGVVRWLEVYASLIEYKGKPAVQATYIDINERKHAEQALQESEEKFRALVEEISDWVWEMDAQGYFTYSNNAVEDILGYSVGQILGCTPFDFLHPDELNTTLEVYIASFKEKTPIRAVVSRFRHRDGSTIVLEARGHPILDEKGNLNGYRGIYRDITDRLRMIEQLRELSEQL